MQNSSEETIKELQPLQLLNMVDQFIAENIDCPICIDDLANFVCMNKYSFMRCFKELAGCTAYQYIINTRLKEAEALIKAGTPFTNAAEKCGFSDYSCFYRCFHNKYKMSPQKYFEGYVQNASSANGQRNRALTALQGIKPFGFRRGVCLAFCACDFASLALGG